MEFTIKLTVYYCMFVWFDSLRPSQQFFSDVGKGLPGLNQYYTQRIKCLAKGHNVAPPVVAQTHNH